MSRICGSPSHRFYCVWLPYPYLITFCKCHIYAFTVLTKNLFTQIVYILCSVKPRLTEWKEKHIQVFENKFLRTWCEPWGTGSKTAMETTAKWGLRFSYPSLNIVCGLSGGSRNKCLLLVKKTKKRVLLQELRLEGTLDLKWILRWDRRADFAKWRTAGCSVKVRPHRTRSAAADCGLCPLRNVTF